MKNLVFALIFLLFFILQFNLVYSLSTSQCRYYVNGVCQPEGGYLMNYTEENPLSEEPLSEITTPYQSTAPYQNPFNFIIMIFQLIGIIVLFTLLIMITQEIIKSRNKRAKKR